MNPLIPIGGIGIALYAASQTSTPIPDGTDPTPDSSPIDYNGGTDGTDFLDSLMNTTPTVSPGPNGNITAFLAVIRAGESSNNYGAYVGGGSFTDFSHHPALPPTNWPGIPGPSHACGAYQFEPGTWLECQKALNLPDFSPASQDAAAIYLLQRRGAYTAIQNSDIQSACDLLKNEWQMFTQAKWSVANVTATYQANGGV
jgi:lysozyme